MGKPNSVFCALFVFLFLSGKVVKWHAVEFWRNPVFTSCNREGIHYRKSNSGWLSAKFCLWNVRSKCPRNNQSAHWDSTCLVTTFPWWKCPGEIAVCVYCSLPHDFFGNKSESLRNTPSQTYYTAQHCRIVQDRQPCHSNFLLYDFVKKIGSNVFELFPCCFLHFT